MSQRYRNIRLLTVYSSGHNMNKLAMFIPEFGKKHIQDALKTRMWGGGGVPQKKVTVE